MSIYNQLLHSDHQTIHVVGLPRSMGTALHLALTQAPEVDGQLNEPFYYPDLKGRLWAYRPTTRTAVRSFEQGCHYIWEKCRSLQTQDRSNITLVVHDLSQDLSDDEFQKISTLAKHVIFVVRDPIENAMSMFLRYVNDKVSQPGGNKLSLQECLTLMGDDASFTQFVHNFPEKIDRRGFSTLLDQEMVTDEDLPQIRKKVLEIFLSEYTIAWQNMQKFCQMAKHSLPDSRYTIFDSKKLTVDVENNLRELVDRIPGLSFTPAMQHRWTKGVGADFDCIITKNWGEFAQHNAWNGPVRNSKGLKEGKSFVEKIALEEFPIEVQAEIQTIVDLVQKEGFM